jgi:outer membrane protein TolC
VALIVAMLVAGCARGPTWTPVTVQPPASLEAAMAEVDQARAEGGASFARDAASTLTITRDGAVLITLARNRSLAVQRFGPEITATNIDTARAEFDPNLMATATYSRTAVQSGEGDLASFSASRTGRVTAEISNRLPTGTEIFLSGGYTQSRAPQSEWTYTGMWSAGVTQSLLRGFGPSVNLVDLRQARNTAAASEHELRGFIIDLVQQVDTAYWELVLALETLKIREAAIDLAEEQLALTLDMIEVGKFAEDADVSARAELASSRADLVDAEGDVRARMIELVRLLSPDSAAQWQITLDPQEGPDVERVALEAPASALLAMFYRPDLAQGRLDLANRELEVVRTRNGLLPRLDAFGTYTRTSSGSRGALANEHLNDSDSGGYELGANFEMALLNRAERAANRRAHFQEAQAAAAIANLEQQIEADVRQAVIEAERQWERTIATKEVVESRQEEYDVEVDRFRIGKSTNLDVLQVYRDLISAQVDEVTSRVRYIEALTSLYVAEGTLLERRGIGTVMEGDQ